MAGGVLLRGISHAAPRHLSLTSSSTGLRRLLGSGPVERLASSPATSVPATSVPATSVLVRCVLARTVLTRRVPATSVAARVLASSVPVRSVHLDTSHCAGHNKWSKVKHIKGPKDEARGRMFMKYGMMIRIAVKGKLGLMLVLRPSCTPGRVRVPPFHPNIPAVCCRGGAQPGL